MAFSYLSLVSLWVPLIMMCLIDFMTYLENPSWTHLFVLNLITFARTLFSNKVTYRYSDGYQVYISWGEASFMSLHQLFYLMSSYKCPIVSTQGTHVFTSHLFQQVFSFISYKASCSLCNLSWLMCFSKSLNLKLLRLVFFFFLIHNFIHYPPIQKHSKFLSTWTWINTLQFVNTTEYYSIENKLLVGIINESQKIYWMNEVRYTEIYTLFDSMYMKSKERCKKHAK